MSYCLFDITSTLNRRWDKHRHWVDTKHCTKYCNLRQVCGKYAETVPLHNISIKGKTVKLSYFPQWKLCRLSYWIGKHYSISRSRSYIWVKLGWNFPTVKIFPNNSYLYIPKYIYLYSIFLYPRFRIHKFYIAYLQF